MSATTTLSIGEQTLLGGSSPRRPASPAQVGHAENLGVHRAIALHCVPPELRHEY
jgi:hypothetical protein